MTQRTYNPGYRKSWGVVIGINNYQKWPKLESAVADARSMADLLQQRGFDEIIPLPHPRFIMQYRRKQKQQFIDQYLHALNSSISL